MGGIAYNVDTESGTAAHEAIIRDSDPVDGAPAMRAVYVEIVITPGEPIVIVLHVRNGTVIIGEVARRWCWRPRRRSCCSE